MIRSLWLADAKPMGFSSDKRKANVIVIGAGLTGMLTAWRLCNEGLDVIVLEAAEVGSGTSGYTTGKITSQHHLIYRYLIDEFGEEKAKKYAEANQWAVQEYFSLIAREKLECHLEEQPACIYADETSDMLEKEYNAAVRLGLPCSLEHVSLFKDKVLTFRRQGQFHPRRFLMALAEKLTDRGGTIIEHCRVHKVDEKKTCTVTADTGVYEADAVVYATLFPILDHSYFSFRLRPTLHQGMAFSVRKKEFSGMFIGESDISFRYFEDTLIVVGRQLEFGGKNDPYVVLGKKAREKFAVQDELFRWSAHDQQTPDRIPYIGNYEPTSKKQFAATGFGAWGISHAMVAARLIADQIAGRENSWASLYSPWRTGKIISMAVKKSQDAIKSLTRGRHLCAHMKCGVIFNPYDQTYDCPCHGSRYDSHGNVLWGPAVHGIKVAEEKK